MKTRITPLNEPPRCPVRFEHAPRNPIPAQGITPLPTERVSRSVQTASHASLQPALLLQRTPLQATPVQPCAPAQFASQPLQCISCEKQQVDLAPLPLQRLSLKAMPLPAAALAPLAPTRVPQPELPSALSHACLDAPRPLGGDPPFAPLSGATGPMPLLAEQRLALQGQQVALRPLAVATRPVKTRTRRVRRKKKR